MERRNFIKVTSAISAGLFFSESLFSETISFFKQPEELDSDRLKYLYQRISIPPPNKISLDYAKYMTSSLKETEGIPMVVRRAKAFYHILDNIPIEIDKGELIVGGVTNKPRVGYFAPESWYGWKTHVKGNRVEGSKERYTRTMDFEYSLPKEVEEYWTGKESGGKVGHFVADYEKVLKIGFSGIKNEIKTSRKEHLKNGSLTKEKSHFLQAAEISCDAAIRFSERYAELAKNQAGEENDPLRKKELLHIAKVCKKCLSQPAGTFYEAMQAFWFTHVLLHLHSADWSISPGRFDQYMYPFYKADLEGNKITRQEAEEMLASLWIKFNEIRVGVDIFTYQNLMIGGVDKNGNDASNDITWMCLKAQEKIVGAQPSLSMRWHKSTPPELLDYASKLLLTGCSKPALFNDEIIIPALLNLGVPLNEARNYAVAGCEEITLPGTVYGIALAAHINNANCLLKALKNNQGKFEKFDDILQAYEVELGNEMKNIFTDVFNRCKRKSELTPHPYSSLLFNDCIDKGEDITEGGSKYNWVSLAEAGTITVSDSLYAIKKAVFENQVFTMNQFTQALENDFAGYEKIQAYCKNRVPKFGNDIDEIDDFAIEIVDLNHKVINRLNMKNFMGGKHIIGAGAAFAWSLGKHTGATPDGRKKGSSLSLSYGPTNGADIEGPTAMLNSISKLKWENQPGGALSHLRLPYSGFDNEQNTRDISALVSTFFDNGGMGLHCSIVDAKVLRAAIKEPEKHLDIMVRVGGFTAQFALLSPYLQQEILQRTEHGI